MDRVHAPDEIRDRYERSDPRRNGDLSDLKRSGDQRPQGENEMAFYELRQYKVLPGKIDEWIKIMEEEIIPFQVSKGMVVCGSFQGETDGSVYVWLRRVESEPQREALYKAVYESEFWKSKIAPRVANYLDRPNNVVTRIVPTPKSTVQ